MNTETFVAIGLPYAFTIEFDDRFDHTFSPVLTRSFDPVLGDWCRGALG